MDMKLVCIKTLAAVAMLSVTPPNAQASVIRYTSVTNMEKDMYFQAINRDAEDLMRTQTLSFGQDTDLVFDFVYTALPEFSEDKGSVNTELLKNHLKNLLNVANPQHENDNLGASAQLTPNDSSATYLVKATSADTSEQIRAEAEIEANGNARDEPLLLGTAAAEKSRQTQEGPIAILMKQPAVKFVVQILRSFKTAHIFVQLAIVLSIFGALGLVNWSMRVKIKQ